MEVEDFLDFRDPNYIRLEGSLVSLDIVLQDYLHKGDNAEEIASGYVIPLTGVYVSILYYLAEPEKVGKYVQDIIDAGEAAWQEQQKTPTPGTLRMRRLMALSKESGLPLSDPNNPARKEIEREKAAAQSSKETE